MSTQVDELFGKVVKFDSAGLDFDNKSLEGKFCEKLFNWLEVDMNGRCWLCCPGWLPYSIGNWLTDSWEEIWNGPKARELRNQVYTGEWKYCQASMCPEIQCNRLPNIDQTIWEGTDGLKGMPGERNIQHHALLDTLINKRTTIDALPSWIFLSNDESCNLKCPSCRMDKILFTSGPEYDKRKEINDKIVRMFFTEPTDRKFGLMCTGSGDPFASKIYRDMLSNIDGKKFPNLLINLQTNATMFTVKMWNLINKIHNNLSDIAISVDAGTKQTYENVTRLNGDWDLLLENMRHLNERSYEFPKINLQTNYVVQSDNFREMKTHIEVMRETMPNIDMISFCLLTDWGTWNKDIYETKCIWKNTHPDHEEFLNMLQDPIFKEENIDMGNVQSLLEKATA